jgi:hypothetical protein
VAKAKVLAKVVVKAVKKPSKMGRPSAFKPEFIQQAYKLCLLGATDAKLGDFFGVSEQTVNAWKFANTDFLESITHGKLLADAEVAEALYNRARGYSHKEDDIRTLTLPAGKGSKIVITPTIKHYPPDTQAASLWLRNRQPADWRDKTELQHGNDPVNPLTVHTMSTAALLAIATSKKPE